METLKAVVRDKFGTRQTRKLRRQGLVPGIIYGHGEEPVSFAINSHDLGLVLQHGEHVVEMELDGSKQNFLIKDVQHDAFGQTVIHVDFVRVNLDETVQVTVPIILRGTPAGAADGGVLMPGLAEIEVECLVVKIPEEIRVRVNDMKAGDFLHVSDLPPMEGVKYLADPDAIVASCKIVAVAPEPEEAPVEGAEPTQPEVIGKGKKEEEGAEGAEAKE